ncbi:NAD(+) diphosphatase [Aestuariibius insulae]|uniref:NAD(+) diphosphatase n=1 Tax=Aestuariibius insulae TaxID=2058287 RepID=UPI00345E7DE5
MKIAEQVTFGGSGWDRAATARADAAALRNRDDAVAIPFSHKKPLLDGAGRLHRLPARHDRLQEDLLWILLGQDGSTPTFAVDVSHWIPEEGEPEISPEFFDRSEQRFPFLPPNCGFADLRMVMTQLDRRDAELAATGKALIEWHESHGFCANCGARSTPADGGWQRVCPACKRRHFPRTDPVVIMLVTHGNDVLVGRSPGWPEGMYSLLAGFVEPGETIEAAVRRETIEEAGIEIGQVSYLASQPWPFPASLMVGCHAKALTREITLDPVELEDARWVSREEMMDVFAGTHPELLGARPGAIAHFILRNWLADRLD